MVQNVGISQREAAENQLRGRELAG